MPLLYAVVARSTTVLAKYASCAGNFSEVTEQILAKISSENSKLTYSHGSYLFHYVNEDRLVYLCITDDDFERSRAFKFLNEIKRRFYSQYGTRAQTALPYAMNSEFSRVIASQMRHFNDDNSQLNKVQGQVDELKGIMVKNIGDRGGIHIPTLRRLFNANSALSDHIADRGERLELLVDKTDDLSSNAVSFKKASRNLARSLWLKNVKITVIIVVIVIVIIYFIVSAACGGLDWRNCTQK